MNKKNTKKYNKRLSENHKIIFKIDKIILYRLITNLSNDSNVYFIAGQIENPIRIEEYFYSKDKSIEIDTEYNVVIIYSNKLMYTFNIKSIECCKENNLRIIKLNIEENSVYKLKER